MVEYRIRSKLPEESRELLVDDAVQFRAAEILNEINWLFCAMNQNGFSQSTFSRRRDISSSYICYNFSITRNSDTNFIGTSFESNRYDHCKYSLKNNQFQSNIQFELSTNEHDGQIEYGVHYSRNTF